MKQSRAAQLSSRRTQSAARRFKRRQLLAFAGRGILAAGLAAPLAIGSAARAASGELRVLIWSNYIPKPIKVAFEERTGYHLKQVNYGSNEALLNRLTRARGEGFDLVSPTLNREPQWSALDLLQPWDMDRVPTERIEPAMLAASLEAWRWGGGIYHLPYVWGTEALSWRTDKWQRTYAELSFGDLWLPEMRGLIQGRPHSMMAGIGLYLDRIGKLPSNRLLDAYRDEASMRRIWTEITRFAVKHKPWIRQFWNDHDAQKSGLTRAGVVLGQTWDGPALELTKAGKPVRYMAPQEGAIAWLDGLSIPIGARNLDAVYAFIEMIYTPEIGAMLANESGYNATSAGASAFLDAASKQAFEEAYPEDAIDKLWWWPAEPVWYAKARGEFRDRFVGA